MLGESIPGPGAPLVARGCGPGPARPGGTLGWGAGEGTNAPGTGVPWLCDRARSRLRAALAGSISPGAAGRSSARGAGLTRGSAG